MRMATIFLIASGMAAGATSATESAAPLQPLAFLVGHCWSGAFPGGKATDTHCFEYVYGGRFIRDRHVVRGERPDYSGESIYWVDGTTGRVTFIEDAYVAVTETEKDGKWVEAWRVEFARQPPVQQPEQR